MMRIGIALGLAFFGNSAVVHAASCDFSWVPKQVGKTPIFTPAISPGVNDAAKNYVLNRPFNVKIGEPVIRRLVSTAAQDLSFSFSQDITYKADWFLAPKYRLSAGRSYSVQQEANSKLWVIAFPDSTGAAYLFLDRDGHLCDRVGSYYNSNGNWTLLHGHYAAQPDIAAVPTSEVNSSSTSGIAILLTKLDAVSIELSVRHLMNGVYSEEIKKSFDNLAGVVFVQGYQIKINSVGNSEVNVTVLGEPSK